MSMATVAMLRIRVFIWFPPFLYHKNSICPWGGSPGRKEIRSGRCSGVRWQSMVWERFIRAIVLDPDSFLNRNNALSNGPHGH